MLAPPPLRPRPDRRRRRLLRLYDRLHHQYGPQRWWPARSRFEVVVGAILTQNAAWRNAERAIARLRAAGALSLPAVLALPPARLAALLRPSGTFRVKARRLRGFARHVARRHGGRLGRLLALPLPGLRAELRGIAGVGPETADAIALYAAGRPVFVVDAYTRRILARHRLAAPDADYADVQALLMGHLPHDPALFNEFHALLVRVGKAHCRTRPRCEGCPLRFDLRGRPPRL
jgi:endonuclease-3 related protein